VCTVGACTSLYLVLVQPRGWGPENWDFMVLPIMAKTSAHPGRMTKYCSLRFGCRDLPHYRAQTNTWWRGGASGAATIDCG
jgi:hypothetical protein